MKKSAAGRRRPLRGIVALAAAFTVVATLAAPT